MSDFRTPNTADLSLFEEQKKIILDECKTKNWDQYGADPITEKTMEKIDYFISFLPAKDPPYIPYLFPLSYDGGVQLEWYSPGNFLEYTIFPNGKVKCFTFNDDTHKNSTTNYDVWNDELIKDVLIKNLIDFYR